MFHAFAGATAAEGTDQSSSISSASSSASNSPVKKELTFEASGYEYRYFRAKSQLLGRGTFAKVYKGKRTPLSPSTQAWRDIAVKEISLEHDTDKAALRLQRESMIWTSLLHRNIVQVYDVVDIPQSNRRLFFTELCEGSLEDQIGDEQHETGMAAADALEMLRQMGEGLAYLQCRHEGVNAVVHRDIKPANILYSKVAGRIIYKIADFGLAREVGEHEVAQSRTGTPLFAAPEITTGRGYQNQFDLYSIGCVLYFCLTKRILHKGKDIDEVCNKKLQEHPEVWYADQLLRFAPQINRMYREVFAFLLEGLLHVEPTQRLSLATLQEVVQHARVPVNVRNIATLESTPVLLFRPHENLRTRSLKALKHVVEAQLKVPCEDQFLLRMSGGALEDIQPGDCDPIILIRAARVIEGSWPELDALLPELDFATLDVEDDLGVGRREQELREYQQFAEDVLFRCKLRLSAVMQARSVCLLFFEQITTQADLLERDLGRCMDALRTILIVRDNLARCEALSRLGAASDPVAAELLDLVQKAGDLLDSGSSLRAEVERALGRAKEVQDRVTKQMNQPHTSVTETQLEEVQKKALLVKQHCDDELERLAHPASGAQTVAQGGWADAVLDSIKQEIKGCIDIERRASSKAQMALRVVLPFLQEMKCLLSGSGTRQDDIKKVSTVVKNMEKKIRRWHAAQGTLLSSLLDNASGTVAPGRGLAPALAPVPAPVPPPPAPQTNTVPLEVFQARVASISKASTKQVKELTAKISELNASITQLKQENLAVKATIAEKTSAARDAERLATEALYSVQIEKLQVQCKEQQAAANAALKANKANEARVASMDDDLFALRQAHAAELQAEKQAREEAEQARAEAEQARAEAEQARAEAEQACQGARTALQDHMKTHADALAERQRAFGETVAQGEDAKAQLSAEVGRLRDKLLQAEKANQHHVDARLELEAKLQQQGQTAIEVEAVQKAMADEHRRAMQLLRAQLDQELQRAQGGLAMQQQNSAALEQTIADLQQRLSEHATEQQRLQEAMQALQAEENSTLQKQHSGEQIIAQLQQQLHALEQELCCQADMHRMAVKEREVVHADRMAAANVDLEEHMRSSEQALAELRSQCDTTLAELTRHHQVCKRLATSVGLEVAPCCHPGDLWEDTCSQLDPEEVEARLVTQLLLQEDHGPDAGGPIPSMAPSAHGDTVVLLPVDNGRSWNLANSELRVHKQCIQQLKLSERKEDRILAQIVMINRDGTAFVQLL